MSFCANNTQLYIYTVSDLKEIVETLFCYLEAVLGGLEDKRTNSVLTIWRYFWLDLVLSLEVVALNPEAYVHSLGVLLAPGLLLDDRVATVAKST